MKGAECLEFTNLFTSVITVGGVGDIAQLFTLHVSPPHQVVVVLVVWYILVPPPVLPSLVDLTQTSYTQGTAALV